MDGKQKEPMIAVCGLDCINECDLFHKHCEGCRGDRDKHWSAKSNRRLAHSLGLRQVAGFENVVLMIGNWNSVKSNRRLAHSLGLRQSM